MRDKLKELIAEVYCKNSAREFNQRLYGIADQPNSVIALRNRMATKGV